MSHLVAITAQTSQNMFEMPTPMESKKKLSKAMSEMPLTVLECCAFQGNPLKPITRKQNV